MDPLATQQGFKKEIKRIDPLAPDIPAEVKTNIEVAKGMNPDKEARAINLGNKFGVPWHLIRGNEEVFEKLKTKPEAQRLIIAPKTSRYYKDLDATAVSFDDSESLINIENIWDGFKDLTKKASTSYDIGKRTVEGGKLYSEKILDTLTQANNEDLAKRIADFESREIDRPIDTNFVETGVTAAAEMVPIIGDTLIGGGTEGFKWATIFGGAGLALGGISVPATAGIGFVAGTRYGAAKEMFLIEAGNAYREMSYITNENGEKIDPDVAAVASVGVGLANASLEYVGLRALTKIPGVSSITSRFTKEAVKKAVKQKSVRDALKNIAIKYGKGVTTEALTEMGQEVVTVIGAEIAKTFSEDEFETANFMNEVLPRVAEAGKEAAAATLTLGLPFVGVRSAIDVREAQKQAAFQERLDETRQAVEETLTKERSPEMTERHLDNVTGGEEVYITPEGISILYQEGSEDILEKAGFEEATEGVPAKTSVAKIHAYLTPEEQELIRNDLKPSPSAMSQREIESIDMGQEIKRIDEQVKDYTEKSRSIQKTKNDLRKQIIDSGFDKQYADSAIQLVESFADRMSLEGLDKEDFLKKFVVTKKPSLVDKAREFFTGDKKESIQISDDKYLISLFENKNEASLIHELGHAFLNEYSILSESEIASEELKTDYSNLKEWLGVTEKFETEHQEKFARAFETYLKEGKAPTRELKTVFRRFKDWLISVYGKARDLVDLNDDVRGIFDRMFTNRLEAFESAKANNLEVWTKEEMDALGVLQEDRKYMSDLYDQAISRAEEEVTWRQNKARAENNSREEANNEADQLKEYIALTTIKQRGGLNAAAVEEMFGAEYITKLQEKYGKSFVVEGAGVDPVEIAVLTGFARSDEMIRAIYNAPPKEEQVRNILARKQAESDRQYQVEDYLTAEWGEFMRLKASYLEQGPTSVTPTKALKQYAKDSLGAEKVRDAIANKKYLSSAANYSRIETQSVRKKDFSEASRANRIARLNFAKTELAFKNRQFLNKTIRSVARLRKSKSVRPDTMYQIQTLAARFGMLPKRPGESLQDAVNRVTENIPKEDRISITEWAQEKIDGGYNIRLPKIVLDGTVEDYRDITWEQFEQLKEAFDQIKTIDRQERYYTAFAKAQELTEVKEVLLERLRKAYEEKDLSARDEIAPEKFLKSFDAWSTKVEIILRMIDGEVNGKWWNYFFKPIQEAENNEYDRFRKIRKDLRGLFKKTDISMFKKIFTEGMPRPLTKPQVLAVALNWGAQDNRNKLMEGWGWSEDQVNAILDNLTEKDWNFVQNTWDYIDSFREESFAVAKDMTGVRPKRVEPVQVTTKYGTFKGGYYPLAYDPRKSLRTSINIEKRDTKEMFQKSYGAPNTKPGSHIERVATAGGQKPILDLSVIPDHIFDVVHDITHRKAVVNIAKLIRDKEIQDALTKTIGIDAARQLTPWLADISNEQGKPSSPLHKFASWARKGTTVVALGLRLTTMVQQFLGAANSIDEIGIVNFAKGMNMFYGTGGLADIGKRSDFIKDKSGFMRNRLQSFDRDIRDATKAITPTKKIRADIMKFSFLGIGLTQWYGVDAPTWMGAYNKFLNENKDLSLNEADSKAVDYADSVVRQTQGSGAVKDLSKIQRGSELMRMFTMFYSWFNTQYNLGKLRLSDTAKGRRPPVYLLASAALLWFIPATLSEIVSARGPDDDEGWVEWGAPLLAMFPFQTVVGLRDIASAVGTNFGYKLTPAQTAPENLIWLSKDIYDAISEEETEGLTESALEASGYLFHFPSKQLSTWLFNIYDIITGEDDELNYKDFLKRNKK